MAVLLSVLAWGGVMGCGDDPFRVTWTARQDTVLIFSLARPELNLPSAFNFNRRLAFQVEAPGASGAWDLAVDTQGGELVLLTPQALGIAGRSRVINLGPQDFAAVAEAPADTTLYEDLDPVALEAGSIYVVRSGGARTSCVFFSKFEPLEVDAEQGTLLFLFDSNPICNDRRLIAPDSD